MVIGIMGESGAGKTTSMRTLDPKTTVYIDCDKERSVMEGMERAVFRRKQKLHQDRLSADSYAGVDKNQHTEKSCTHQDGCYRHDKRLDGGERDAQSQGEGI